MATIAISCGDTNGIGPEISIKLINRINLKKNKVILTIPQNVFSFYLKHIKINKEYITYSSNKLEKKLKSTVIINLLPNVAVEFGKPTKESGEASIVSLTESLNFIDLGIADAVLTAPISKYAIKLAGYNFPGHTEFIAERYNVKNPVMTFVSDKFLTALVTIHVPLNQVSKLITRERLLNIISVIKNSLIQDFNKKEPKIAVLGLNPHAGEQGEIGKEEIEIINKIIKSDETLHGPFVPDAFFGEKKFLHYDLTLGMYHDQVLIPFKLLAFDKGVNFTAGLPIIRTSPDHGTAFDIAGKNLASEKSMFYAYNLALKIYNNRQNVSR